MNARCSSAAAWAIPPLYGLARRLRAEGKAVSAALGFHSAADVFLADELRALGVNVHIATDDGSAGLRGLVTDAMDAAGDGYTHLYTCGPEPMLRAVYDRCRTDGQFSFEERMGCGFGACMGCSCKTKYGTKRICKDGPVLRKGGDCMVNTSVTLCGLPLENPVIPASGTFGYRV